MPPTDRPLPRFVAEPPHELEPYGRWADRLVEQFTAACGISVLGGLGNGVQWVSVMSAIQGLTSADYQARVVGLLESSGFAMPGVGFLLGGVLAYLFDPRVSFLIAGAGVLAVVAFSAPLLRRTDWPSELEAPAGVNEALAAEVDAPVTVQGVRPETASDPVES